MQRGEMVPLHSRRRAHQDDSMFSSVLPLTGAPELLTEFSQRIIHRTSVYYFHIIQYLVIESFLS